MGGGQRPYCTAPTPTQSHPRFGEILGCWRARGAHGFRDSLLRFHWCYFHIKLSTRPAQGCPGPGLFVGAVIGAIAAPRGPEAAAPSAPSAVALPHSRGPAPRPGSGPHVRGGRRRGGCWAGPERSRAEPGGARRLQSGAGAGRAGRGRRRFVRGAAARWAGAGAGGREGAGAEAAAAAAAGSASCGAPRGAALQHAELCARLPPPGAAPLPPPGSLPPGRAGPARRGPAPAARAALLLLGAGGWGPGARAKGLAECAQRAERPRARRRRLPRGMGAGAPSAPDP